MDEKDFEELLRYMPSRSNQQRVPRVPRPKLSHASRGSSAHSGGSPQRVIVKVSYGPPTRLKTHMQYLQREGVGLDGQKPELFTSPGRKLPIEAVKGEQHLFRVILSPENSQQIPDMKLYTQEFMTKVNQQRAADLQWFATVHYNTGNPHSHIVVRGIDTEGKEVRLDRTFISHDAREIASRLATRCIGYRTQLEINEQISRDLVSPRFTQIDRGIYINSYSEKTHLAVPRTALEKERLDHLCRKMNLGHNTRSSEYELDPNWRKRLEYNGRQQDVIKTIYNDLPFDLKTQWTGPGTDKKLSIYRNSWTVQGKVVSAGIADESTDRAYLLIEANRRHYFYSNPKLQLSTYQPGQTVRLEQGKISLAAGQKIAPEISHSGPSSISISKKVNIPENEKGPSLKL